MKPSSLTGDESLFDAKETLSDSTALDFWRWAFGDLRQNNLRGVFCEWMVARLLDIDLPAVRDSWFEYDLKTQEGVTLEVKSSAYLQAWHEKDSPPSKIVFNVPKTQTWTLKGGYSGVKAHNADLYAFCFQTETDAMKWNAMDLNQWRFHILPRKTLTAFNVEQVSLSRLLKVTASLNAEEFRTEARRLIANIESESHPSLADLEGTNG